MPAFYSSLSLGTLFRPAFISLCRFFCPIRRSLDAFEGFVAMRGFFFFNPASISACIFRITSSLFASCVRCT